MVIERILKSPGFASAIIIGLLISSYIFTILYNISSGGTTKISSGAQLFMFLTIIFLILFLAGFSMLIISFLKIKEIREIFINPEQVSIVAIVLLVCSYVSNVMHNYVSNLTGALSSVSQIFFYLSLVFIVLFIIIFVALLVSFSNKFIYKKI